MYSTPYSVVSGTWYLPSDPTPILVWLHQVKSHAAHLALSSTETRAGLPSVCIKSHFFINLHAESVAMVALFCLGLLYLKIRWSALESVNHITFAIQAMEGHKFPK